MRARLWQVWLLTLGTAWALTALLVWAALQVSAGAAVLLDILGKALGNG